LPRIKAKNWEPALPQDIIEDATWALIAPLVPPERGRACRPAIDNRRVLERIVWIARTGSPNRDLPDRLGKWNTGAAQVCAMPERRAVRGDP